MFVLNLLSVFELFIFLFVFECGLLKVRHSSIEQTCVEILCFVITGVLHTKGLWKGNEICAELCH